MWFIGIEVEQETGAPPPKKNPGSAPDIITLFCYNISLYVDISKLLEKTIQK